MTEKNEQAEATETETPSSPPSEVVETSDEVLNFEEPDFGAITDFVEGHEEVEAPQEEAEPAVAAEAEVQETPVEEEAPPEVPAEAVESESAEETPKEEVKAAEPEVSPEPEPVKVPTKEEIEGMYAEHREKLLPELEKVFTLSDEEAAALDEQPSTVLPKLAAQMQYDVMLSTYNAVVAALPNMMQTFNQANDLATKARNQFIDAWPELDNPKAEPVSMAAVQAYRAANPRANLEEVIQNAGVMAMINLGLDPMRKKKEETKPTAAPRQTPPKPVAPTGAAPVPPTKQDKEPNMFSELAAVFEEEFS